MTQWIVREFDRPATTLVNQIAKFPTGILSDCLNRFHAMDAGIRPIKSGMKFCGPALTVQAVEGCNWGGHQALLLAKPGDVLVIAARGGMNNAVWGHVMTTAAKRIPLAGIVVDGCIRDGEENIRDTLPIYSRGVCPGGPHKGWPCELNGPVSCGGVPVMPGDVVVGDGDGVVVVPIARIKSVLEEAKKRIDIETDWYRRLEGDESTVSLLGIPPA